MTVCKDFLPRSARHFRIWNMWMYKQKTWDFLQRVYMGTFLKLGQKGDRKGLPLSTLKDGDPLPSILYGMGAGAESNEETVLDVVISPASHRTLYNIVKRAEKTIYPGEKDLLRDPEALMEKVESFGREVFHEFLGKQTSRKTTTKQKSQVLRPRSARTKPHSVCSAPIYRTGIRFSNVDSPWCLRYSRKRTREVCEIRRERPLALNGKRFYGLATSTTT